MTHTYAILKITEQAYQEIRERLIQAGYQHAFHAEDVIDMHGIAVSPGAGPPELTSDAAVGLALLLHELGGGVDGARSLVVSAATIERVCGQGQPQQVSCQVLPNKDVRYFLTPRLGRESYSEHAVRGGALQPAPEFGDMKAPFDFESSTANLQALDRELAALPSDMASDNPDDWAADAMTPPAETDVQATGSQPIGHLRREVAANQLEQLIHEPLVQARMKAEPGIVLCRRHDFGLCLKHRDDCAADSFPCVLVPWPESAGSPWCAVCSGRLLPRAKPDSYTPGELDRAGRQEP